MSDPRVPIIRIVHTIHACHDIDVCRRLYQDALGGLVFAENYFEAEDRDAALLYVTDHMVEPMAPHTPDDMSKPFARMMSKIGQAFHSFELMVADGAAASAALRAAGAVTASDYGFFFFVRPASTGGVLVEVCERPMPNDPYDRGHWNPMVGAGHAGQVMALDHIACVTADMAAVLGFFTGMVNGEVVADERTSLPQPARRVVIRLGGTDIAFLQPDDAVAGPLGAFLARPQNGIYALVWRIADEAGARAYFADKLNLRLTQAGCVSSGFAIEPEDFLGARHEFIA